jgi:hypothetical protein
MTTKIETLEALRGPEELDALPVGSVIADITEPDALAVACKAVRGWQFLGDDPERRYLSIAMLPGTDVPHCPTVAPRVR